MSAETDSSTDLVELFVPLLEEGTPVLRPTRGKILGFDRVLVLATPEYDPSVEKWAFPPGTVVTCVSETRDGRQVLVASEKVS
ncbi:MAG: hypothetical protein NZM31_01185 [Gemmatales bacterium]|nr:hypothetical protein [Gemmatales bacterium]MDW8385609.1 hypothetical protein [Gemmatales bacterium]